MINTKFKVGDSVQYIGDTERNVCTDDRPVYFVEGIILDENRVIYSLNYGILAGEKEIEIYRPFLT